MIDSVVHDGLWCAFEHVHMGEEAEIVAEAYGVTREEQDEFAYSSHMKAQAATEAGRFRDEIVPVEIPGKKGATGRRARRAHTGRHHPRDAGRAPARLPQEGRHGDGGQRARTERRRLGDGGGERGSGARAGPAGAGAHHRLRRGGDRATHDLRLPAARGAQAAGAHWPEDERLRRDRGQRGVRGAGARQRQGAGLGLGARSTPTAARWRWGTPSARAARAC